MAIQRSNRGEAMRAKIKQNALDSTKKGGGTKFKNLPEGIEFFRPKAGIVNIDIIPYVVSIENHPMGIGAGDIYHSGTMYLHYGVGIDEKTYVCRKTVGKKCPICDYAAELRRKGGDEETLKNLAPKRRDLYNVIDLDNKEKGLQLWEFSYFLFGQKLEEELLGVDNEAYLGYALHDDGYSLKIRFKDKAVGTGKFVETTRIDFIERRKQYDDSILEKAVDLDAILQVLDYEELQVIFLGMDEDGKPNSAPGSSDKPESKPEAVVEPDKNEEETTTTTRNRTSRIAKPADEDTQKPETETKPETKVESKPEPKSAPKAEAADGKSCPSGGTFGVSTDTMPACDKCAIWEECIDAKEKAA